MDINEAIDQLDKARGYTDMSRENGSEVAAYLDALSCAVIAVADRIDRLDTTLLEAFPGKEDQE